MYKFSAFVIVIITMASCATILSTEKQKVNLYSNVQNAKVIVNDTITYDLPATIEVLRDKKDVNLSLEAPHIKEEYILPSKINPIFTFANLLTVPVIGAGYFIDLTSKKRFAYKKNIFLGKFDKDTDTPTQRAEEYIAKHSITSDSIRENVYKREKHKYQKKLDKQTAYNKWEYKRFHPSKGTFYFNIITPSIYTIGVSAKNPNLTKFKSIIGGISLGVAFDYFYADKQFVTLELAHRSNVMDPFYFLFSNSYDLMVDKVNLSIIHNHRINRFNIGYGISLDKVFYSYRLAYNYELYQELPYQTYTSDDGKKQYDENYVTLGFSGLLSYQWTPRLHMGVFYKPSIYSLRSFNNSFDYEHIIGLDVRLKF